MSMNYETADFKTLSIVIPVYNEEATAEMLVQKVLEAPLTLEKELVIVNDCSKDGTAEILGKLEKSHDNIRVFHNEKNMGKGFAVRRGFDEATGDIIVVQDADLEYDPNEFQRLLNPILEGHADVVYGSRFITTEARRVLYYWHFLGNQVLTLFSNMVTNLNLSDMETCYKMFRAAVIKKIHLTENRFGIEPEVTFKLSRVKGLRMYEIGISYHGRSYAEGKKINWKDGFRAFYVLFKNTLGYIFKGRKLIYKKGIEEEKS